jgi:hypothetical protein
MLKEISERILLIFVYGAMASFIPVLMVDGNMWYIGSAHLIRMIFLSFYVLFFPSSRLLEIIFQLSNFATVIVAYIFTGVYKDVFENDTSNIFKYFYVILECVTIFINLIFLFSIFNNKAKVHDVVAINIVIE